MNFVQIFCNSTASRLIYAYSCLLYTSLSEAKAQLSMLEQQYDNEGSLQRRLADFLTMLF